MVKRNVKERKTSESTELDMKLQQADPMIQYAVSGYRKEIKRLQKQLVKEQITHESEKAHLLERIKQEKIQIKTTKYGQEKS